MKLKFIREIKVRGNEITHKLYKSEKPIEYYDMDGMVYTTEYIIASKANHSGILEVMIFPAWEDGKISDFTEMGYMKGDVTHEECLIAEGYELK